MLLRCSPWRLHAVLPVTFVAVVNDLYAKCPRTMVLEPVWRTVRVELGDLVSNASYALPYDSGTSTAPRCHLTSLDYKYLRHLRLPQDSGTSSPRISTASSTFPKKRRQGYLITFITSTRVASKMHRSIIAAALTAIAYVATLPSGSGTEVSQPNLLGSNFSSDDTATSFIRHMKICTRGPDFVLTCTGKSSEVNPTCDFTDWCKWYMSPFREMRLCKEEGDIYWTVECCMEGLKNSCGGKEPRLTGVRFDGPP